MLGEEVLSGTMLHLRSTRGRRRFVRVVLTEPHSDHKATTHSPVRDSPPAQIPYEIVMGVSGVEPLTSRV
jgi:hypothetical protein